MKRISLLLFALSLGSFAFTQNEAPRLKVLYNGFDSPPIYAGCTAENAENCNHEKMAALVNKYVRYPEPAIANGTEGVVWLAFEIDESGLMENLRIQKSLGDGCDFEAKRILERMRRWIPAQKDGVAIASTVELPVVFQLSNEQRTAAKAAKERAALAAKKDEERKEKRSFMEVSHPDGSKEEVAAEISFRPEPIQFEPKRREEEIFKVTEQMPCFPGCEEVDSKHEQKKCADEKMLQYLYSKVKYPKLARNNGTEGIVVIRFVVEKDGAIKNAEIVRGIGDGCEEEALRVVSNMPNWNPGMQRGKAVRVQFNLPVSFKL